MLDLITGGVYMPQQNMGMYGMVQNNMMAPAPNMQYQQQMAMVNMPQQVQLHFVKGEDISLDKKRKG
jgi:hypothetical protein